MTLYCPECGNDKHLLVYEETAFELNTGDFFCNTVKMGDSFAPVVCTGCSWEGKRQDLKEG